MNRKPERKETNAARQARLREQRKARGWRRLSLWLSPEQVDTLETLGGEPWLGATVKAFLESVVSERLRPPVTANPLPDNDKTALWREADSLNKAGLSWGAIARRWNAEGRRTDKGTAFIGSNLARDYRKWQGGTGNE